MLRKGLSVSILLLMLVVLAACRRAPDVGELPTVAATTAATAETPATAAATTGATSTVPTAAPATLTNTPTPSPTALPATATAIPPTHTAVPPTATTVPPTATRPPATTVPPTATPPFGPPPGGSARITFAPGATSATVQSTLAAGGDGDTWIIRVLAGQVISIQTLATPPGAINVMLMDMNGGFLASNLDTAGISAVAPATGDYQINLATPNAAPQIAYTMQVFVPPGSALPPTRIQFAPGASVAQLNDSMVAGGDLNQYVLSLAAGQNLSVGVFASVPAVTNIAIRNSLGQQVASGTDMSGLSITTGAAGDYFIDVSSGGSAPAYSYVLTVTAPPVVAPPTIPAPQPQRIAFGPGQFSAAFNGQVVAGGMGAQFVIRVLGGQTLITHVSDDPVANVDITVQDAGGNTINFGRAPTEMGTRVPATGDYLITLSTSSATPVNWGLTVTVPPLPGAATRIVFPAGGISATVSGDLPFGGDVDTWVIAAQAGQTLTATLANNTPGWLRIFVYNAAGDLIALGTDPNGAAAPLSAGDTFIVVVSDPAAGPIGYNMTVTIP